MIYALLMDLVDETAEILRNHKIRRPLLRTARQVCFSWSSSERFRLHIMLSFGMK